MLIEVVSVTHHEDHSVHCNEGLSASHWMTVDRLLVVLTSEQT